VSVGHAFDIRGLSGRFSPGGAGNGRWQLSVERLQLRIYEEALEILARSLRWPIRIRPDGIHLKLEAGGIPVEARVTAVAAPDGYLRGELASIKAASFLPIPTFLVSGALHEKLSGRPGVVRLNDTNVDFDLAALLSRTGFPIGGLPPLRRVQLRDGYADLEYGAADETPV
jgi:hypothetical protein